MNTLLTSADFAKPVLNHLRRLVHTACHKVEETIRWGFLHFDYKGMMCSMAYFKQHCAFGFRKSSLMQDAGKFSAESRIQQTHNFTLLNKNDEGTGATINYQKNIEGIILTGIESIRAHSLLKIM